MKSIALPQQWSLVGVALHVQARVQNISRMRPGKAEVRDWEPLTATALHAPTAGMLGDG